MSIVVFGDPWLPWAPLKGPRPKSDGNVISLAAFWLPPGNPLGSSFLYFSILVLVFSRYVLSALFGSLFVFLGTPSNLEEHGSVQPKPLSSQFQLELQKDRKRCPKRSLWDAVGYVCEFSDASFGDGTIVFKMIGQKSCR